MERKNYLMMLGAPKCGTTSLSAWLGEQPYAALARTKETLYFTDFADHSWNGPSADFAARRPASFAAFDAEFHHSRRRNCGSRLPRITCLVWPPPRTSRALRSAMTSERSGW